MERTFDGRTDVQGVVIVDKTEQVAEEPDYTPQLLEEYSKRLKAGSYMQTEPNEVLTCGVWQLQKYLGTGWCLHFMTLPDGRVRCYATPSVEVVLESFISMFEGDKEYDASRDS